MNRPLEAASAEGRPEEDTGSRRRVFEWIVGSCGLLFAAVVWIYVFHIQDRARTAWVSKVATDRAKPQGRPTAVPALLVASRAACKPAWRLSLNTLQALDLAGGPDPSRRKDIQALESLLAVADNAWEGPAAKSAVAGARFAACAPDDRGAWALALGTASHSSAPMPNHECGDVLLDIVRIDERGASVSAPAAMLSPDPDCHTNANAILDRVAEAKLTTVADMNNDGVPEVVFDYDGTADFTSDLRALFTSHQG
jgi:hypothetical protein